MKLSELLKQVHHSDLPFGAPTSERVEQYERIFGKERVAGSTKGFIERGWQETGRLHLERLRDRIIDANPVFANAWAGVEIIAVQSQEDRTSIHSAGSERVVVVDSHVMQYLWMMNKAQIYGKRLAAGDQRKLICELYLHFGTLRHFGPSGPVWPKPKTPSHASEDEFATLFLLTEIQELFLVAHELAHIVCDGDAEVAARLDIDTRYHHLAQADPKIEEELRADALALDLVMNAFPREAEVEETVLSSIFLLIRYRLWLAVAFKTTESDYEFWLWFARNSLFRNRARFYYSGGAPAFLVEMLEELEQTLEPAAEAAEAAFQQILETGPARRG